MRAGRAAECGPVALRLHEAAERLWAASNYVESVRLELRTLGHGPVAGLADSAARELEVAITSFRDLRRLLDL